MRQRVKEGFPPQATALAQRKACGIASLRASLRASPEGRQGRNFYDKRLAGHDMKYSVSRLSEVHFVEVRGV